MSEFNVLQNLHLCAQKSVCATSLGPFGEIGANFSLQLSSRTQFDRINKKKVIAENQCEKHKKSSLVVKFRGGGDYVLVVKFSGGDYVLVVKFLGGILSTYTKMSRGVFVRGGLCPYPVLEQQLIKRDHNFRIDHRYSIGSRVSCQ